MIKKALKIVSVVNILFAISLEGATARPQIEWKNKSVSNEIKDFFNNFFVLNKKYSLKELYLTDYNWTDYSSTPLRYSIKQILFDCLRPIFVSDDDYNALQKKGIFSEKNFEEKNLEETITNLHTLVNEFLSNVTLKELVTQEAINTQISLLTDRIKKGDTFIEKSLKKELENMTSKDIDANKSYNEQVIKRKDEIKKLITSKKNPLESCAGLAALVYEYSNQDESLRLFQRQIELHNNDRYKDYFVYSKKGSDFFYSIKIEATIEQKVERPSIWRRILNVLKIGNLWG